jgi:hypothetical protein
MTGRGKIARARIGPVMIGPVMIGPVMIGPVKTGPVTIGPGWSAPKAAVVSAGAIVTIARNSGTVRTVRNGNGRNGTGPSEIPLPSWSRAAAPSRR